MADQSDSYDPEELIIVQMRLHCLPLCSLLNQTQLRSLLSLALNHLHLIPTEAGRARDYRGLAELYEFAYQDVQSLSRSNDPVIQLLTNVDVALRKQQFTDGSSLDARRARGSVATLIRHLRSIERFDVIDDLVNELRKLQITGNEQLGMSPLDALLSCFLLLKCSCSPFTFLQRHTRPEYPKLGTRIQNLSLLEFEQERPDETLTLDDLACNASSGVQAIYDAYVSYADNDLPFVQNLCDFLESPQVGLKLFVRERDLLIGQMQFHAFTELMEKRCKRLLIVLSPEFLNSAECEFQTRFTMSLQIQERQRRLVPIVYRSCELPALIRFLSKIDLSRGDQIPQWTWRKLIFSLRTQSQDGHFLPCSSASPSTLPINGLGSLPALPFSQAITSELKPQPQVKPPSLCTFLSSSAVSPSIASRPPIITELNSCSTADRTSDSSNTTKSTVKLVPDSSSSTDKPSSTSKPLLSRIWKKINRTPLKR
jgi:hypothetical protein